MKITTLPPESLQPGPRIAPVRGYEGSFAVARAAGGPSRDRVEISSLAADLAHAATASGASEGASAARLAELRQAIEGGTFPIDIRALAEAILAEEGDL